MKESIMATSWKTKAPPGSPNSDEVTVNSLHKERIVALRFPYMMMTPTPNLCFFRVMNETQDRIQND